MKNKLYESIISNIDKQLKTILLENENADNLDIDKQVKTFIKTIFKNRSEYIKGIKILKNPFNTTIKSKEIYVVLIYSEEPNREGFDKKTKYLQAIHFTKSIVNDKISELTYVQILGSMLDMSKTNDISIFDNKKLINWLNSFNDTAKRSFIDFMFENGEHQFNWNIFIEYIKEHKSISPKAKKAAQKLISNLIKAHKDIKYAIEFLNIISPNGDSTYDGVTYKELIPAMEDIVKKYGKL